jgi:hypothetical protein
MKKLLIVLLTVLLFVIPVYLSESEIIKDVIPSSAIIIKSYDNGTWVKWKFENQCFLSRIYCQSISSIKVDCEN